MLFLKPNSHHGQQAPWNSPFLDGEGKAESGRRTAQTGPAAMESMALAPGFVVLSPGVLSLGQGGGAGHGRGMRGVGQRRLKRRSPPPLPFTRS